MESITFRVADTVRLWYSVIWQPNDIRLMQNTLQTRLFHPHNSTIITTQIASTSHS